MQINIVSFNFRFVFFSSKEIYPSLCSPGGAGPSLRAIHGLVGALVYP